MDPDGLSQHRTLERSELGQNRPSRPNGLQAYPSTESGSVLLPKGSGKKLFASIPVIEGKRVTLRKLVESDADAIGEMANNAASARVLEKNDFIRTSRNVEEDWGYPTPTLADKWFR